MAWVSEARRCASASMKQRTARKRRRMCRRTMRSMARIPRLQRRRRSRRGSRTRPVRATWALHVQTDGNPRPLRAELLGVALALAPGRAAYIPFPVAELTETRLPRETVLGMLAPLLADPSVLKICAGGEGRFAGHRTGALAGTCAGRRPAADLLRWRGGRPRPYDCRTRIAASRTYAGIARSGDGYWTQSSGVCRRAGRSRDGVCRRGCRCDAAALVRVAAAVAQGTCVAVLRAGGSAADRHAGGDGEGRRAGGRGRAAASVDRFRGAHGGDGSRVPQTRRTCFSDWAARSNWAKCCSTKWDCRAASVAPRVLGAPMRAFCRRSPTSDTTCPRGF